MLSAWHTTGRPANLPTTYTLAARGNHRPAPLIQPLAAASLATAPTAPPLGGNG